MQDCFLDSKPADSIPLILVPENTFAQWLEGQPETIKRWLAVTGFKAKPNSFSLISAADGTLNTVIVGIASPDDPWACGGLPTALPGGNYYFATDWSTAVMERLALGWGLGAYRFTRYKNNQQSIAHLAFDPAWNVQQIRQSLQAITLVRDLINTPAEDMMPEQLADAMLLLGQEFGAQIEQTVGDELLAQNYPLIHAVGRASTHHPRLLDLRWGDEQHPKVTLVGKGVCFDSGGLDLKNASGMRLMKKDMGGAAHVMGLARLIMSTGLPVRLRVLVAAVENAVAGNALRPGDVIKSRKGLTVEIHNTDAEGRLILCDALTEAASENPALILDCATLTGAARVALGPELPALFCNNEDLATGLLTTADEEKDPLWRMPLHQPYRDMLDSRIADIANASDSSFAGAVTAALFLKEFVPENIPWAHLDVMAGNTKARPGRPEGGEAMGLRAVYRYLRERFGG
ncbi:MAG TPA: leucyl aminopeptidase family protein [Candidatus Competibacteraceae bacterium]|nr:leucyl aminopeptidase family protein [Candidatus Competibacteraceae bacterium]